MTERPEADDRAERALRTAFERRSDGFDPEPLHPRDTRRSRWLPLAAAAAVIVVVATAGLLALRDTDVSGSLPADLPSEAPSDGVSADPGDPALRTVSFLDVAVDVPASWGDAYAPTDQWCIGSNFPTDPYVARNASMMASTQVGCVDDGMEQILAGFPPVPTRLWAPHLSLVPAASGGGDGTRSYRQWTLTSRTVGGVRIELLTDAATTPLVDGILDTARVIATDANGCDTTSPAQAAEFVRPPAFDVAAVEDVDAVAVCQYARGSTSKSLLVGSRNVDGTAADAVLRAFQQAPVGGGPDEPQNCSDDMYGDLVLVVRLLQGGESAGDLYVYYDWCFGNGSDDGTTRRALTRGTCGDLFGDSVEPISYQTSLRRICG